MRHIRTKELAHNRLAGRRGVAHNATNRLCAPCQVRRVPPLLGAAPDGLCASLLLAAIVVIAATGALGQESASNYESVVKQAVAKQQAGDYAGAAAAYRDALKLQPDDVATHVNLGVVLVRLKQYGEAIEQYRMAEKSLPGDARIERNIGLAYEKSGRLHEARDCFERLHSAAPDDQPTTVLLADVELQLGNDRRVIELLEPIDAKSGVAAGPDAEVTYLLGTALFETGNYPAAVKELGTAVRSGGGPAGLQSMYGRALLMTGDPAAADEAFGKELASNPNDYHANLGKAQIAIASHQFAAALPLAQRALAARDDDTQAKLAVAECLAGESRFAEARPYAEAARAADSIELHETLSKIYRGLHLEGQAERERKRAVALRAESDPGPVEGEPAPEFSLSGVSLRNLRAKAPVVLVFGSYTCPNFRDSAPALKSLYEKYGARASFLLVYIREAHATGDWQSGRNTREDSVALLPAASTLAEKQEHAALCTRKLHLPFPSVVDGMDGAVEQAYRAWPSRVFVIGENGRVLYGSRLTELDFHPGEMEQILKRALP